MTSVAIIYNDDCELPSGEEQDNIAVRESRLEAESVSAALAESGFDTVIIPAGNAPANLAAAIISAQADLVFNVCEGFANDPQLEYAVAALFELLKVPYTGSPPLTLALAQDKALANYILSASGLKVPRSCLLEKPDDLIPKDLTAPFMVKPRYTDASHGISEKSFCKTAAEALMQSSYLFATYGQSVVVEEFLPGREFNISILGEGEVLPPAEIAYDLLHNLPPIITFAAKWIETSPYYAGTPVVCPACNISPELENRIITVAKKAYRVIGCRDYGRIDLRLNSCGEPCIIEVNPNPCIMPNAGLSRAARAAGIAYNELIMRIAQAALSRARS